MLHILTRWGCLLPSLCSWLPLWEPDHVTSVFTVTGASGPMCLSPIAVKHVSPCGGLCFIFDNRKYLYFGATYCTSRAPRYRSSVPTQTSRGLHEYLKKTWYERVHASRSKRVSRWAHASHTEPVPAAPPAPSARHHALSPCLTPLPCLVEIARVGFSRHHRHFRDAQPAPARTSALHRHRR